MIRRAVEVGLVGCGRWGQRLLAALMGHPGFVVRAVADRDPARRHAASARAPQALVVDSLERVLPHVEAVIIATPSVRHADHAMVALAAGRDVLVEKPLAMSRRDAERVNELAERKRCVGMVGHILRFDERVERFVHAVRSGRVGPLRELRSRRLTRSGSPDALWTLAPHDVATVLAIDGGPVVDVRTLVDEHTTHLQLGFASGLQAHVEVSTAAAAPCRQTRARGSDGLVVLDELRSEPGDPLGRELDHFAESVLTRRPPRTSLAEGLAVVSILERARHPTPLSSTATR